MACVSNSSNRPGHWSRRPLIVSLSLSLSSLSDSLLIAACLPSYALAVVPRGASILIIQQPWIGLLLDGYKTLEIRGQKCKKAPGEKVYLALSGGGGTILGSRTFVASHGPLSRAEYAGRSDGHCVAGGQLPYGPSTYAWEFKAPRRFRQAVPYVHRHGCVVWATKE